MAAPATLRVELLGGCRVAIGKRTAPRTLPARQQELLAYLALNRDAPVSRQQVAGRLWPESTDAQALTNLRRELHHLRTELPDIDRLLDAGPRMLGWAANASIDVDVAEFDRAVHDGLAGRRPSLEAAAALYHGDLLPECEGEWIRPERERLRRRSAEALVRLVELLEQESAFAEAIDCAQRLLRIDTLQEAAWRTLMRCHARRGERATALHLYQRCVSIFKRELGIQPSPATRLVYRELLEDDGIETLAAASPPQAATYPLIGRQTEFALLSRAWQNAVAGHGQLVLLRGEAGIGKTRLAEELVDWCGTRAVRTAATRCYAGEGRLAYAPIAAWLQTEALRAPLLALEPVWASEIARLRPELLGERTDVQAPEPQLEPFQRSRLFEALSRVFRAAAPLLLVVDDLQWCDSDTLEWLHFFFRSSPELRCLVVGTVRSDEEDDNASLAVLRRELERHERIAVVTLGPLDEGATARLAEAVAERPLDADLRARVFRHSEGHPLFIVETGRAGLSPADQRPYGALPPRVQAVVAARLTQLSPEAREIAELAAVVGRDFAFDVLAHAGDLEEHAIVRALDELWRRQIVRVQAGDRWDFGHDRLREVAYASIGPARRRLLHRRVAQALEQLFASDLDSVSASIASHLEQAGLPVRALAFYERAGQLASRVSANEEAIRCLTRGLSLLEHVPVGREREQKELALRTALSSPLITVHGYAAHEVEANLARVVPLVSANGAEVIPARWRWSLFATRYVMGDIRVAREHSEAAMALAKDDPSCGCEANLTLAASMLSFGEIDAACRHFDLALAAYDERHPPRSMMGSDLGVFTQAWSAHALWLHGQSGLARSRAETAVALARRLDQLYSQTIAHAYGGLTYLLQRDAPRVRESAEAVIALCERHGFAAYYRDWARVLIGWVECQEERPTAGIASIERAIDGLEQQRAKARRPFHLSLLAEAHAAAGNADRANDILDRALAVGEDREEFWWTAELHRLKGAFGPPDTAEGAYRRSLDIAREQGSRALELRAAISLADLYRRTGRSGLIPALFEPVLVLLDGADRADRDQALGLLEPS
jgi:DNA-binding SARP family transcriptional activator